MRIPGGSDRRRWTVPAALAATSALALLARLLALGARVAHWDEARVGYWILQYLQTGAWTYQPILHGPFLFHVDRVVFAALGPSDASMRLVVAVVGGTLPLSAWLYRDHLRPAETVALGAVLAADPLFLFFSRFARNDLLLAAFAFVALGLLLRARATRRRRYLLAAGLALGFAFSTKENAVLYLLCWAAAAAAVVALDRRRAGDGPVELGRALVARASAGVERLPISGVVLGGVLWLLTVVFFYAPRAGAAAGPDAVGLWNAVARPALLPAVARAATVGAAGKLVAVWIGGGHQSLGFRTAFYFGHLIAISVVGSGGTLLLAGLGIRAERRASPGARRPLVAFALVWAGLSLLGYPFVADIAGPWLALHVVLPLAIPAAVGLAALVDRLRGIGAADHLPGEVTAVDRRAVTRAAAVLLLVGTQALLVGGLTSYAAPNSDVNPLAQPAQPSGNLRATARDLSAVACDGRPTALYVGPYFAPGESYRRFPLRWYLARSGFRTAYAPMPADVPADPPPVVVALDSRRHALDGRLPGYEVRTSEFDTWVPREPAAPFVEVAVYVNRTAASRGRTQCG